MLGKIYYDYYVDKGGYNGNYYIKDNSIYIISDGYINYVSLLNGKVIKSYEINDRYNDINIDNNKIICSNKDKSISIDIKSKDIRDIDNKYKEIREYYNDIKMFGINI